MNLYKRKMASLFPTKNKEALHHAYVLEGEMLESMDQVEALLSESFGMDTKHPDIFVHHTSAFGVDDAALVVDKNSRKPTSGLDKIIIVSLTSVSHQAQNNLLKTLEEPNPGTYIFIIVPTASILLPTILSRVHVLTVPRITSAEQAEKDLKNESDGTSLKGATGTSAIGGEMAKEFIESNEPDRLEIVKKILADKEKEIVTDKDIYLFVRDIERLVDEKLGPDVTAESIKDRRNFARVATTVAEYMYDTSSSKKLLLEYMALRLPKF